MINPTDDYFLQKEEPERSCMLFLREYILRQDENISEAWKYGMPFYCFSKKMFCYLWVHKKFKQPYLGIVEGKQINHPDLIIEKRARMKILLIDPNRDIPIKKLDGIFKELLTIYR